MTELIKECKELELLDSSAVSDESSVFYLREKGLVLHEGLFGVKIK